MEQYFSLSPKGEKRLDKLREVDWGDKEPSIEYQVLELVDSGHYSFEYTSRNLRNPWTPIRLVDSVVRGLHRLGYFDEDESTLEELIDQLDEFSGKPESIEGASRAFRLYNRIAHGKPVKEEYFDWVLEWFFRRQGVQALPDDPEEDEAELAKDLCKSKLEKTLILEKYISNFHGRLLGEYEDEGGGRNLRHLMNRILDTLFEE